MTIRMRPCLRLACAGLLLPLSVASGEPTVATRASKQGQAAYTVDWHTNDGGGGRSTGGNYALTGTIGQPDADPTGPSSGGAYQADGGFWGGASGDAPTGTVFKDGFD